MSNTHPKTEARSGNFIFIVGENNDLTLSVVSSNVADITLNAAMYPTSDKDVYIPSNKIETDPLVLSFIVSEDFSEWIGIYKWILEAKNYNGDYERIIKTCTLIALDSQNEQTVSWTYTDCWPMTLESMQFMLDNDNNQVLTTTSTLRYNKMKVKGVDGEEITEDYGKRI